MTTSTSALDRKPRRTIRDLVPVPKAARPPRRQVRVLRPSLALRDALLRRKVLVQTYARSSNEDVGPNGLKIEKETTHDLLSCRRRASMA